MGVSIRSSRIPPEEDSLCEKSPIEEDNAESDVEVVYDPVLNCYYDPNTHEYYELS